MPKRNAEPTGNEQRVAAMGVREEEAAVLVEMLNRLDAQQEEIESLIAWADQFKDGQSPEKASKK